MAVAKNITEADRKAIDAERFWRSVRVAGKNECWPWDGITNDKGYGRHSVGGVEHRAHRVAFALARETALPGVVMVCHRCDTPECCNPSHLFLGLASDNNADAREKGRSRAPTSIKNGNGKLTDLQVSEIRAASGTGAKIAERFGVSQSLVSMIRNGKRRGLVGDAGFEPATFRV